MKRPKSALILILMASASGWAAELRQHTLAAFQEYVGRAETRIGQEQTSPEAFLAIDRLPAEQRAEAERRLRQGEVLVEKVQVAEISDGLVHDWRGTVFLPNGTIEDTLARVQDYGRLESYYAPDVQRSRLLARQGNDFRIFMRLREHKVITVVLDTEYDVRYGLLDAQHWFSVSRSTRIDEVVNAGRAGERRAEPGEEHGFLWRLNTYWRFVQAPDGVLVQCEAISLTRDIPAGLGWLVKPFVSSIPRESLEFSLRATRNAVPAKRIGPSKEGNNDRQ